MMFEKKHEDQTDLEANREILIVNYKLNYTMLGFLICQEAASREGSVASPEDAAGHLWLGCRIKILHY